MGIPKFYYFDIRARGQYVLALLHYFKYDFEFIKFTVNNGIPSEVREMTTFGQVPLYIDSNNEIKLCQTQAIVEYISSIHGFYGSNSLEVAKINEIVNSFEDILSPIFTAHYKINKEYKDEFKRNNNIIKFLQVYENKLKQNKYIAGGTDYTYADLGTYITYDYVTHLGYVENTNNYPKLNELKTHFESLPQLKNYIQYIKNIPKEKEEKY